MYLTKPLGKSRVLVRSSAPLVVNRVLSSITPQSAAALLPLKSILIANRGEIAL